MLRKVFSMVCVFWIPAVAMVQAQNQDIRLVDMDRVFNEFYKTELAQSQLKQQAADFTEEREALVAEYEGLQATFNAAREEAQNRALSEEVRNEKRNEAEEKLLELREYENKIRTFDDTRKKELDAQSKRMRSRIVGEIQEQIDTFARNLGLTAIIDMSGQSLNGIPVVIYHDSRIDITDRIIQLVNQGKASVSASDSE